MSDSQMTIKDVAHVMGVDEKTVRRWIKNQELSATKDIFGRYQISHSDLDAFVERRRRKYNPKEEE